MNFAMMDGNVVLNTIAAESLEIAESLTGYTCIEYDETTPVCIGYVYENSLFYDPNPPVLEVPKQVPILD